jgi:hypothetical protein
MIVTKLVIHRSPTKQLDASHFMFETVAVSVHDAVFPYYVNKDRCDGTKFVNVNGPFLCEQEHMLSCDTVHNLFDVVCLRRRVDGGEKPFS